MKNKPRNKQILQLRGTLGITNTFPVTRCGGSEQHLKPTGPELPRLGISSGTALEGAENSKGCSTWVQPSFPVSNTAWSPMHCRGQSPTTRPEVGPGHQQSDPGHQTQSCPESHAGSPAHQLSLLPPSELGVCSSLAVRKFWPCLQCI